MNKRNGKIRRTSKVARKGKHDGSRIGLWSSPTKDSKRYSEFAANQSEEIRNIALNRVEEEKIPWTGQKRNWRTGCRWEEHNGSGDRDADIRAAAQRVREKVEGALRVGGTAQTGGQ